MTKLYVEWSLIEAESIMCMSGFALVGITWGDWRGQIEGLGGLERWEEACVEHPEEREVAGVGTCLLFVNEVVRSLTLADGTPSLTFLGGAAHALMYRHASNTKANICTWAGIQTLARSYPNTSWLFCWVITKSFSLSHLITSATSSGWRLCFHCVCVGIPSPRRSQSLLSSDKIKTHFRFLPIRF